MIREKGVRGFQKAKERAIERSGKRANEGGAHQKRDWKNFKEGIIFLDNYWETSTRTQTITFKYF